FAADPVVQLFCEPALHAFEWLPLQSFPAPRRQELNAAWPHTFASVFEQVFANNCVEMQSFCAFVSQTLEFFPEQTFSAVPAHWFCVPEKVHRFEAPVPLHEFPVPVQLFFAPVSHWLVFMPEQMLTALHMLLVPVPLQ